MPGNGGKYWCWSWKAGKLKSGEKVILNKFLDFAKLGTVDLEPCIISVASPPMETKSSIQSRIDVKALLARGSGRRPA